VYNLANGDTSSVLAYDGKNLFANDHSLNGQTIDNLLALPLTTTNLNTAKVQLQRLPLGPNGEYLPMYSSKFVLIVPPALEFTARLIVESTTIPEQNYASGNINPLKGAVELVVCSELTDQNDWYLIAVLPGMTPFATIKHVDSSPKLMSFISETDQNVVERDQYQWVIKMFEETYPVHYYLMLKSVQS
jgi:hypothetical protein